MSDADRAPAVRRLRPAARPGVTVLEASAGTGKTFTIAALAARYVAEGTPLDQLLLVTFTRMATGELRDRVRERLVSAERGLDARARGRAAPARDDGRRRCSPTGDAARSAQRRDRLARALADFDAATIATTHGFCQEVLGGLGIAGDVEPDTTFVEDLGDLVEEVVDDLYVRRFHAPRRRPDSTAREALRDRAASRSPTRPRRSSRATRPTTRSPAMRVRLAEAVREELERAQAPHRRS